MGDVFQGLRRIVLIDSELKQLQAKLQTIGADLNGLTDALGSLRDRVSRLEGFIEGAAAVRQTPPQLPRD